MFSISFKVRDCASLIFLQERQRRRHNYYEREKKALSYRSTSRDFLLLLRRFQLCVIFCVETRRNRCKKRECLEYLSRDPFSINSLNEIFLQTSRREREIRCKIDNVENFFIHTNIPSYTHTPLVCKKGRSWLKCISR